MGDLGPPLFNRIPTALITVESRLPQLPQKILERVSTSTALLSDFLVRGSHLSFLGRDDRGGLLDEVQSYLGDDCDSPGFLEAREFGLELLEVLG